MNIQEKLPEVEPVRKVETGDYQEPRHMRSTLLRLHKRKAWLSASAVQALILSERPPRIRMLCEGALETTGSTGGKSRSGAGEAAISPRRAAWRRAHAKPRSDPHRSRQGAFLLCPPDGGVSRCEHFCVRPDRQGLPDPAQQSLPLWPPRIFLKRVERLI